MREFDSPPREARTLGESKRFLLLTAHTLATLASEVMRPFYKEGTLFPDLLA